LAPVGEIQTSGRPIAMMIIKRIRSALSQARIEAVDSDIGSPVGAKLFHQKRTEIITKLLQARGQCLKELKNLFCWHLPVIGPLS
jgi:hypothetical protein